MKRVRTITALRATLSPIRSAGRRVALVPTMGAFHDGHVALMTAARHEADLVVVSLFVNPTQFGAVEDLARYPRDEATDARRADAAGVDVLFAPSVEEMYPPGFATTVDPGPIARGLCGDHRPGHFAAVATVVTRLLGIVAPDLAYFGLKDYQQVAVIRRVVADLALPVTVRALPTVREPDGLAMSSRNRQLSPDERTRARSLYGAMQGAAALRETGVREPAALVAAVVEALRATGIAAEYVELRDAETLGAPGCGRPAVLALAATVGTTRLIDNIVLPATDWST